MLFSYVCIAITFEITAYIVLLQKGHIYTVIQFSINHYLPNNNVRLDNKSDSSI